MRLLRALPRTTSELSGSTPSVHLPSSLWELAKILAHNFTTLPIGGDGNAIATAAGFAQTFACSYPYGRKGCLIPSLGLGSYIGGGEGSETAGGLSGIWEYKADYQKTFGRHTLYVGGNIDTNNLGKTAGGNSGLTFSPFQTSNGSTGGDELASLLLSVPEGASRINTDYWETGGWVDGFYGQDQWKIRNNLTINVGLRYDVFNDTRDK